MFSIYYGNRYTVAVPCRKKYRFIYHSAIKINITRMKIRYLHANPLVKQSENWKLKLKNILRDL